MGRGPSGPALCSRWHDPGLQSMPAIQDFGLIVAFGLRLKIGLGSGLGIGVQLSIKPSIGPRIIIEISTRRRGRSPQMH